MIVAAAGGWMVCAEPGCTTPPLPVQFCLLVTGGFGFKPADLEVAKTWQVTQSQNGVFICRCHEHRQTVNVVQAEGAQIRQLVPGSARRH